MNVLFLVCYVIYVQSPYIHETVFHHLTLQGIWPYIKYFYIFLWWWIFNFFFCIFINLYINNVREIKSIYLDIFLQQKLVNTSNNYSINWGHEMQSMQDFWNFCNRVTVIIINVVNIVSSTAFIYLYFLKF
jgi:hypothetical protein